MKITLYTTTDCQFSKQEKDYLTANHLTYEERNLESNKEFLTEMLAVSNNFAGTPVTKIEKDDGKIEILKGFTMADLDKALNLGPQAGPTAQMNANLNVPPPPKITEDKPPVVQTPPPVKPAQDPVAPSMPPAPVEPPPATPPTPAPSTPAQPAVSPANDPLNSILSDLQQKAGMPNSNTSTPPVANSQPASSQSPTDLPSIPDFSSKT